MKIVGCLLIFALLFLSQSKFSTTHQLSGEAQKLVQAGVKATMYFINHLESPISVNSLTRSLLTLSELISTLMMTPRELLLQLMLFLLTKSSPSLDWRTPDVTKIVTEMFPEMSSPVLAKFGKTLFPNDYPENQSIFIIKYRRFRSH